MGKNEGFAFGLLLYTLNFTLVPWLPDDNMELSLDEIKKPIEKEFWQK